MPQAAVKFKIYAATPCERLVRGVYWQFAITQCPPMAQFAISMHERFVRHFFFASVE